MKSDKERVAAKMSVPSHFVFALLFTESWLLSLATGSHCNPHLKRGQQHGTLQQQQTAVCCAGIPSGSLTIAAALMLMPCVNIIQQVFACWHLHFGMWFCITRTLSAACQHGLLMCLSTWVVNALINK